MLVFALTLSVAFAYLTARVEGLNTTVVLDCGSRHHSFCHLLTPSLDGSFIGQANETSGLVNYRGIRYADPPVGVLRWRAPVSPPTVDVGVVNASEVHCLS